MRLTTFLLIFMSLQVSAEIIYPLRLDGSRDYTKPAMEVRNGKMYYLRKDGTIDYTKPVRQFESSSKSQSRSSSSLKSLQ